MTDLDRPAFAEALHALAEFFNAPLSEIRAEGYFDALRDHSLEEVTGAVRLAFRTCRFFPAGVELRELIAGRAEDAASEAWASVLREIRRVGYIGHPDLDPRTMRAVRELWGGWQRLCETLPSEGPELVGWIKQFKATYASGTRETTRQLTADTLHPSVVAQIRDARGKG